MIENPYQIQYDEGYQDGYEAGKAELEAERIHFEAVAMTAIEENEKLQAEVKGLRKALNWIKGATDVSGRSRCGANTGVRAIHSRATRALKGGSDTPNVSCDTASVAEGE